MANDRQLASVTTHGRYAGAYRKPLGVVWRGMMGRCYDTNADNYHRYGGRGIVVVEDWHVYDNFEIDMWPRPEGMTLERRENDGPYSKVNCFWATKTEQANNRASNRLITFDGMTMNVSQWAAHLGLAHTALRCRLHKGWSEERALSTPGKKT